jgi:hypothetical protein
VTRGARSATPACLVSATMTIWKKAKAKPRKIAVQQ